MNDDERRSVEREAIRLLDFERNNAVGNTSYTGHNIINQSQEINTRDSLNLHYLDNPRPSSSGREAKKPETPNRAQSDSERPVWRDENMDIIVKNVPKDQQLAFLDISKDEW